MPGRVTTDNQPPENPARFRYTASRAQFCIQLQRRLQALSKVFPELVTAASSSHSLDGECDALTATNAHREHGPCPIGSLQMRECLDRQDRTDRIPRGNCVAIRIDACRVEVQIS